MYMDDEPVVEGVGLKLPPPAVDPDDPLLIAQTLTYVTDDGSVMLSFTSAPFSFGERNRNICHVLLMQYHAVITFKRVILGCNADHFTVSDVV
jgi:hypothetical protein